MNRKLTQQGQTQAIDTNKGFSQRKQHREYVPKEAATSVSYANLAARAPNKAPTNGVSATIGQKANKSGKTADEGSRDAEVAIKLPEVDRVPSPLKGVMFGSWGKKIEKEDSTIRGGKGVEELSGAVPKLLPKLLSKPIFGNREAVETRPVPIPGIMATAQESKAAGEGVKFPEQSNYGAKDNVASAGYNRARGNRQVAGTGAAAGQQQQQQHYKQPRAGVQGSEEGGHHGKVNVSSGNVSVSGSGSGRQEGVEGQELQSNANVNSRHSPYMTATAPLSSFAHADGRTANSAGGFHSPAVQHGEQQGYNGGYGSPVVQAQANIGVRGQQNAHHGPGTMGFIPMISSGRDKQGGQINPMSTQAGGQVAAVQYPVAGANHVHVLTNMQPPHGPMVAPIPTGPPGIGQQFQPWGPGGFYQGGHIAGTAPVAGYESQYYQTAGIPQSHIGFAPQGQYMMPRMSGQGHPTHGISQQGMVFGAGVEPGTHMPSMPMPQAQHQHHQQHHQQPVVGSTPPSVPQLPYGQPRISQVGSDFKPPHSSRLKIINPQTKQEVQVHKAGATNAATSNDATSLTSTPIISATVPTPSTPSVAVATGTAATPTATPATGVVGGAQKSVDDIIPIKTPVIPNAYQSQKSQPIPIPISIPQPQQPEILGHFNKDNTFTLPSANKKIIAIRAPTEATTTPTVTPPLTAAAAAALKATATPPVQTQTPVPAPVVVAVKTEEKEKEKEKIKPAAPVVPVAQPPQSEKKEIVEELPKQEKVEEVVEKEKVEEKVKEEKVEEEKVKEKVEEKVKEKVEEKVVEKVEEKEIVEEKVEKEEKVEEEEEEEGEEVDIHEASGKIKLGLKTILNKTYPDEEAQKHKPELRNGVLVYPIEFLQTFRKICKVKVGEFTFELGGQEDGRGQKDNKRPSNRNRSEMGRGGGGGGPSQRQQPPVDSNFKQPPRTSEERFQHSSSNHSTRPSQGMGARSGGGGGGGGRSSRSGRGPRGFRSTGGRGNANAADAEPVVLSRAENRWVPQALSGRKATNITPASDPSEISDSFIEHKIKSLLNILTVDNFGVISKDILEWALVSQKESDARAIRIILILLFEKAVDEPVFAAMYAKLTKLLHDNMPNTVKYYENPDDENAAAVVGTMVVRKVLLNRCQQEFEAGWKVEIPGDIKSEEYYVAMKIKRRGLGLVRFVGELYLLGIISIRLLGRCIETLLENDTEEDLESLSRLLTTVGGRMEGDKHSESLNHVMKRLEEIAADRNVNSRIRFMLMDVIDLRRANWIVKELGPKTIAQVHADVSKERSVIESELRRGNSSSGRGLHSSSSRQNMNANNNPRSSAYDKSRRDLPSSRNPADYSKFGNLSRTTFSNTFAPGGVFNSSNQSARSSAKKDDRSKRDSQKPLPRMSTSLLSANLASSSSSKRSPAGLTTPSSASPYSARSDGLSKPRSGINSFSALLDHSEDTDHLNFGTSPSASGIADNSVKSPISPTTTSSKSSSNVDDNLPLLSDADISRKSKGMINEYLQLQDLNELRECLLELGSKNYPALVTKVVEYMLDFKKDKVALVCTAFTKLSSLLFSNSDPNVIIAIFSSVAEYLDDIATDAPFAYDNFAEMLASTQIAPSKIPDCLGSFFISSSPTRALKVCLAVLKSYHQSICDGDNQKLVDLITNSFDQQQQPTTTIKSFLTDSFFNTSSSDNNSQQLRQTPDEIISSACSDYSLDFIL